MVEAAELIRYFSDGAGLRGLSIGAFTRRFTTFKKIHEGHLKFQARGHYPMPL